MGQLKMYLPNGEPCKTINEFVTCYSYQYYYKNEGHIAEDIIDGLLFNKSCYDEKDIHRILAWKIDGIDCKKTNLLEDNLGEEIIYYKKWEWNEKEPKGRNNGNYIGNTIKKNNGDKIITMRKLLKRASALSGDKLWVDTNTRFTDKPEEAKRILMELVSVEATQMGSVYLFTLLYFLTKARWPIYDKYAFIALKGLTEGKNPFEKKIEYHDRMPQKDRNHPQDFPDVMERILFEKENNQYWDYIDMLEIFNKAYINEKKDRITLAGSTSEIDSINQQYRSYIQSRNIDRALWAYGHLFKIK